MYHQQGGLCKKIKNENSTKTNFFKNNFKNILLKNSNYKIKNTKNNQKNHLNKTYIKIKNM